MTQAENVVSTLLIAIQTQSKQCDDFKVLLSESREGKLNLSWSQIWDSLHWDLIVTWGLIRLALVPSHNKILIIKEKAINENEDFKIIKKQQCQRHPKKFRET